MNSVYHTDAQYNSTIILKRMLLFIGRKDYITGIQWGNVLKLDNIYSFGGKKKRVDK